MRHLLERGVYFTLTVTTTTKQIRRLVCSWSKIDLDLTIKTNLTTSETNFLTVKVCGKQKNEVRLVVPGCYQATINQKKVAETY